MTDDLLQQFESVVLQEFAFLPNDYGFNFTKESDYYFVAKAPYCHIVIELDRNIVGCWIERLDLSPRHPRKGIAVEWVARSSGYQDNELRFLNLEQSIERQIQENARLLRSFGRDFLQGDFSGWEKVIAYANEQWEIEEEKRKNEKLNIFLAEIRQEAEAAWQKKDYAQVITLYETMHEFLTPSEWKKLEYSRKHIVTN